MPITTTITRDSAAFAAFLLLSTMAEPVAAQIAAKSQGRAPLPMIHRIATDGPTPVRPVELRFDPRPSEFRVPAPAEMRLRDGTKSLEKLQSAITINYLPAGNGSFGDTCIAWPAQAATAFTFAVTVWSLKVYTPVPITIDACWSNNMSPGVLGHAGATSFTANFSGAPLTNVFYPRALANARAGTDLSPANADIYAAFSSIFSWYFGTDGIVPGGQVDFVSVVLHEVGHGLGFSGSMTVSGGSGSWGQGTGLPFVYDRFTENGSGQLLTNTTLFPNPSAALATQLQGNPVFFDGTSTRAANGNNPAPLYAPVTWNSGSSYSHLAESYNGTANALMTFSISSDESIHDPGPVTLGIMKDMGWLLQTAQAITFGTAPSVSVGAAGAMSATGGGSTSPVVFSSLTSGVCSVSGTNGFTVTGVTVGTCTIAANQAGQAQYNAAPQVTQSFSVNKGNQATLVVTAGNTYLPFGTMTTLGTTGGSGTGAVTFASDSGSCMIVGTTLTAAAVGSCLVTATKAGDINYNAATGTQVFEIAKANQAPLVANAVATTLAFGETTTLGTTGGSGTGLVSFASNNGNCTIVSTTLTAAVVGACTVTATKASDASYNAATATVGITVTKASQAALVANAVATTLGFGETTTLGTTGGSGTGLVSFASNNGNCTIAGTTLTAAAVGLCTVTATKAADASYNAATATVDITVIRASQATLVATSASTLLTVGMTTTLGTTGGSGTGAVDLASSNANCTIVGTTLTAASLGACTVTATKAGDANYDPASATVDITIATLGLVGVVSRKTHGAAGDFDLTVDTAQPIGGTVTVEPRAIGSGHTIVFQFSGPVTSAGTAVSVDALATPTGIAAPAVSGNDVIVTLTGVPDNRRVSVSLAGVDGLYNVEASVGFLVGDVNSSRSVTASDILQVKGRSGQLTDATNFRYDLNASGSITASDILAVKGRSGLVLP